MVRREVLREQWYDRDCPFGFAPLTDLAHRLVDGTRGSNDHALEACRVLSTKIRHMAVIGADRSNLERRVGKTDEAQPGCRDQEMDVRSFVIHVLDAVLGLIVLHAWPRHLAAHPSRFAPREGLARGGLTEDPPIVFCSNPIIVGPLHTADRSLPDSKPVGYQLGKAPA